MRRNDDWITDLHNRFLFLDKERHFYHENGNVIMTEEYHIERGTCCGSGCSHCPFSPSHQKMNTQLREDIKSYKYKE